jgi:hypothetical protein
VCIPKPDKCGYTVQETLRATFPQDHRLRYANYGKGVLFWQDDSFAARFVNEFQDVVSADAYWFTDEDVCGYKQGGDLLGSMAQLPDDVCHLAANYGRTVDRMRGLVEPRGSRPVWAFVELGHPFTQENWPTIRPAQVRAAVWSSLIHGARGIIYFNHSFAGPCKSQHILRDPCYGDVRAEVSRLDAQVTRLAPVLNGPTVEGALRVDGPVDAVTKYHDGSLYVLSGANTAGGGSAAFTVRCAADQQVTVLDESRTVRLRDGRFEDAFADGDAVHLYQVHGPLGCGLG